MSTRVSLIAAVAENGVIGSRGGLPWRIRSDLRKFRAITMGSPLVMGRKTFESIGRVLDGRDVIVVTRQHNLVFPEGVLVADSLEAALALAEERAAARGVDDIFVVGGGEIYAAAIPLAERLHVTHVSARPEGDTRFPEISPADWTVTSREPLPASEGDTATGEHVIYSRRR